MILNRFFWVLNRFFYILGFFDCLLPFTRRPIPLGPFQTVAVFRDVSVRNGQIFRVDRQGVNGIDVGRVVGLFRMRNGKGLVATELGRWDAVEVGRVGRTGVLLTRIGAAERIVTFFALLLFGDDAEFGGFQVFHRDVGV